MLEMISYEESPIHRLLRNINAVKVTIRYAFHMHASHINMPFDNFQTYRAFLLRNDYDFSNGRVGYE